MKSQINSGTTQARRSNRAYSIVVVAISLIALVATHILANSSYEMSMKTQGFSLIIATFLTLCVVLHLWNSWTKYEDIIQPEPSPEVDRQLLALSDANEFFAGSLNASDSFRLVASRVHELVAFRTMTLHILDAESSRFQAVEASGTDAEIRRGRWTDISDGIIARTFFSQVVEIDHATASSRPAAAIPLLEGLNVFGVLHLDFELIFNIDTVDLGLLDAIGTRTAPLLLSSITYQQNQSNSLTDATTDLPNERAFHLVLENQVAESIRKGSTRPLTILALDIRSFEEINTRFGHASGDRVLGFVAQIIKDNLRQMDFFAHASADEFLIVLPTASKEISHEVIARIHTGFFGRRFRVNAEESVEVELNVGWAAFGTDGETPDTLLRVARERKEQSKTTSPNKVLWFPTEFAS